VRWPRRPWRPWRPWRLGWLPLLLLLQGCGAERPWNVLLVTLDSTRADYLGAYGRESARTPHLDRLAAEGFLFADCVSTAPVTLPSHSTIHTGTYPPLHGVRDNGLFRLPEERTTLAEVLRARGYATGAAIGAFPLTREFGLTQGFAFYDDHITVTAEDFRGRPDPRRGVFFDERPGARVNDAILPWLRERDGEPFFAWIHYWDPHHPLVPPAPYGELFHHDPYQGEIANADQSLGVVLRQLEESGEDRRTVVVVVGDHGEGRGDHGEETHSFLAYDSTLRVPLIVRVPGRAGGRRIEERVGTVDVVPTILDLLGLEPPAEVQGRSLVPLMEGRRVDRRQLYYAEAMSPRLSHGWGELRVLYDEPYKYIHGPRPKLFDLAADPRELDDLIDRRPEVAERMKADLAAFLRTLSDPGAGAAVHDASGDTRQRLAALGYLSTGGADPGSVREELRSDGTPPGERVGDNNLASRLRQQISRRDYLSARETALRLVERDPRNAFYRGMLAASYLGLGQLDEAVRVVEEGESVMAQNQDVYLQVANELFAAGDKERGLAIARRVVGDQGTPYGHYLLAEMLGDLGDASGRRRQLERAVELDPGHLRAALALAIDLARAGALQRAENRLLELLEHHPLEAKVHFNYAVLLLQLGRSERALGRLERTVALAPGYWQAHLARLAVHVDRGEREEAAEALALLRERCRDPEVLERANALGSRG